MITAEVCPLERSMARVDAQMATSALGRLLRDHSDLLPEAELAELNDAHTHLLRMFQAGVFG